MTEHTTASQAKCLSNDSLRAALREAHRRPTIDFNELDVLLAEQTARRLLP